MVFKGLGTLDNLFIFGQTVVIAVITVNSSKECRLIVTDIRSMNDLSIKAKSCIGTKLRETVMT